MNNLCSFCLKIVRKKGVCCDLCNKWIHTKCNELNDVDYEYLKLNDDVWFCKLCIEEILPFCRSLKTNVNDTTKTINSSLRDLLLQLNNFSYDSENETSELLPNSVYKDVEYFSELNSSIKSKSLSLFHLNINSLQKHFDDFEYFLNDLNLEFDFIGITESRLLKSQKPIKEIK